MARTVGIGIQNFEKIIREDVFYVDKTHFIKEWWESADDVTLIARPRRFGKTLNMSMLDRFFSNRYDNQEELFQGLSIWQEEKFRELAGTYPVISLSFAGVKDVSYERAVQSICRILKKLYNESAFLLESGKLTDAEKENMRAMMYDVSESNASDALNLLSEYLSRHFGKKVLIFLDEYDTPMQEAYVSGYWNEFTSFIRSLFNSTFKTNPYLERAVMTGITRVSKESIFSDLNNLEVVTTTSDKYATCFGLTEEEVFAAMDEQGLSNKEEVKKWYDGFTFGKITDIYNPWSIINYLKEGKLGTYWANTSSNSLVGKLIREGSADIKLSFEKLMQNETIRKPIDEQIVFNQLDKNEEAVWSLLLATGYLKVLSYDTDVEILESRDPLYTLELTNVEVRLMFRRMVTEWFGETRSKYNYFIKSLLADDVKGMNKFMNKVSSAVFSYFDTGKNPSESEPERFYHGFVLGLMVELSEHYVLKSNRESGYGRYDVMLYSKDLETTGIIMEFKVHDPDDEKDLHETVQAALKQIEEKDYTAELKSLGFAEEKIKKYGFAFEGKKVLIEKGET